MTRFEIHDNDIRHNIRQVQTRANVPVWGVLKYDGYGMGAVHMAELLGESGITRFAVTDADEAHVLRRAGLLTDEILLLSPQSTVDELVSALHDRVIFSVGSVAYAQRLVALAKNEACFLQVHIAVDMWYWRGMLARREGVITGVMGVLARSIPGTPWSILYRKHHYASGEAIHARDRETKSALPSASIRSAVFGSCSLQ